MYLNDKINNMRKNVFNISKINKQKVRINKNRDINLAHPTRNDNRKAEIKYPEKINLPITIKPNSKNN